MPRAVLYHSLRRRNLCTQSCGESTTSSKCGVCRRKERARLRALRRLDGPPPESPIIGNRWGRVPELAAFEPRPQQREVLAREIAEARTARRIAEMRAAMAGEAAECVHRWLLGQPRDGQQAAVCLRCGAERGYEGTEYYRAG